MDSRIKCIFCGFCLIETGLNEHMKEFHKIRTLYLKPSQKEASTQITDEDRYLIYPGKRKSVDMKFLTSTPKKAKLDNTESFNMFNETSNDFPKVEPNYTEDSKDHTNLVLRYKCPICGELSNSCGKILGHIENHHVDSDARPVKQNMKIMMKKLKISDQKLTSQLNYYKQFGGLYLHTGVKGNYQCVLKSIETMRDIPNIRSVCNRNNMHIQDYSEFAFLSLKELDNEKTGVNISATNESGVCIFCKEVLSTETLEDHIEKEHNINDRFAIKTLVNMTTEKDVVDESKSDEESRSNKTKFYVTDEIMEDQEDAQTPEQQNQPQHNHCCSTNGSKLNMKFECNWCMKTYNCRFHRNFHENKCNLTYELEKQDPGNADGISLSVFGVRFRCPICEYFSERRKDVRDHIVDFHQGYSKRSGQFVELYPIRQEMRIILGRRPIKKVTKTFMKEKHKKRKPRLSRCKKRNDSIILESIESTGGPEEIHGPTKQTCQLKVNKQLTDEIKAEFNELEKELEEEVNQLNEVSIEVDNDVNDEVKHEIQSDANHGTSLSGNNTKSNQTETESICTETEYVLEHPLDENEGPINAKSGVSSTECTNLLEADHGTEKDIMSGEIDEPKEILGGSASTFDSLEKTKIKETVEEFDGIILEQVDEKDKSKVELTDKELHYILESCQLSAEEDRSMSFTPEDIGSVDEKDADPSMLALLPKWRPWTAYPPDLGEEPTSSENNPNAEDTTKVIKEISAVATEDSVANMLAAGSELLDGMIKDLSKFTESRGLGEITPAPDVDSVQEQKYMNSSKNNVSKNNTEKESSISELEEDNISIASFHSVKNKLRSKVTENSDSVISNSEFEEDNMSVTSFHSIKMREKTKANRAEVERGIRNTLEGTPSECDENVYRSESRSSDSSIKMVSPSQARKPPLSDLQNVPGPSRPCQCPFCPTKFDTAKQVSAHMSECRGRHKKGYESDDTTSTCTTMAESETSMRPPAIDWATSPRSIKTAKMSDIKSNVTNVYIRFVQTYYTSYKKRFPDLSSVDLMQKLSEGYRILRETNHRSVRNLQIEYEKERKAKFSDKIRTIVRSLEEDGCAYFNTSLGSSQGFSCNRLTP